MTTVTSSLDQIREARETLSTAQKTLRDEAQNAINAELKNIFEADDTVTTIQWSQKESEYNDEGMYPGIHGPVVNLAPFSDGDYDTNEWAYGYDSASLDPRLKTLSEILNLIGEEVLSDLYDDSGVVTVTRANGGMTIEVESTYY